jgi:protein-disulfide isomerase
MMENTSLDQPIKNSRPWYRRWWGVVVIVLAIAFGLVVTFYFARVWYLIQTGMINPASLANSQQAGPINSVSGPTFATTDDPAKGAAKPVIVIVEFSDFQCPFCKEVAPVLDQIVKDYGKYVRVIYRDFPLANDHPGAVLAALAGQCAHEQGKFWPMHDLIYANQAAITEVGLKKFATQIGIDSIQFGTCLQSQKYLNEIQQDYDEGWAAGVRATPTLFINGQMHTGVVTYNELRQFVVSYLNN